MTSLLVVLPPEHAGAALPAELTRALAGRGIDAIPCSDLVRQVEISAAPQVLLWQPVPVPGSLLEALQTWAGAPPCALSLASGPLDADTHARLVALGVHAWAPMDALDAPSLDALLARARARWQREAALRTELEAFRTRLDERKWIDRAKGLLMSARGIDEDQAFGLLRGAAMHANLRLGEVSRSVLEAAQWADAINRAGQLRMLSQRLVRVAAQGLAGIDARRARVLRTQSAERVQHNLDHLATLALGQAGNAALARVRSAWQDLEKALSARPAALAAIDARAEALLAAAEVLTETLEASGARRALRIVNICGRQRMRAQRLAKDALLASMLPSADSQQRLAATMDEFEAALRELEAAPLSSPEIRAALAIARDEWLHLMGGVRGLDSAEGRASLVRASDALVDTFERLTASYEHSLQVIMS
ncbi:ANTAR domain-containing protein [Variovorax saccharolyticus]|uniref:ANTAR domain-containing protein n=1 Tax=Variovorax saccharolyticus TaxID=3053516 RepID=UPI002574BFF2|nr:MULTISPECIES: ANTAR domain-containing protein [unclassified Variovorax]MDM0016275.1 type IV pili methyl-accepting chemotaxis transducer N-terminal domain-containing protein [Variovorax sp. J22R187]MDM0027207.1 type IV pili methyl-accepting chemotaxis transducer N-terminal domain-containing protein [Variovorax sp. J31P216]